MKKVLMSLICSFGLLYVFSFKSQASGMVINASTMEYISMGAEALSQAGLFDVGLGSWWEQLDGTAYERVIAQQLSEEYPEYINRFTDLTEQPMPYEVIEKYVSRELYDHEGNLVNLQNPLGVKYCTFDNGYYHGSCLIDTEGYIIYVLDENENEIPLVDIGMGGSEYSSSEIQSAFQAIESTVSSDNYNYSVSGTSAGSQPTYYMIYGQTRSGVPAQVESVFISNQYIPGLIVPVTNSNGNSIQSWYTNDPSLIQHNVLMGWGNFSITSGSYTKGNYTYSYKVDFASGIGVGGIEISNTLNEFLNGQTPYGGVFCFGRNGYFYNSSYINDSVPFYPTTGNILDWDDEYNVNDVITGVNGYAGSETSPSMSYDPTQSIGEGNYPISKTLQGTIASDPSLPVESNPAIEQDPAIEDELPGILEIPSGGFDIPILSGLQNRFPFSIPWDIKNLFKSMRSVATAPRFQGDLYIAPLNYTYHIDIDLAMFDRQAEIFRTCFLISFIIGLCIFSYSHFFGH